MGVAAEDIGIGTDGCGVPVHALPLKNMAMAYARFTSPENLPEKYRAGAARLFDAMNAEPDMVRRQTLPNHGKPRQILPE